MTVNEDPISGRGAEFAGMTNFLQSSEREKVRVGYRPRYTPNSPGPMDLGSRTPLTMWSSSSWAS